MGGLGSTFFLSGQVECGNLCPNSMTLGSIPYSFKMNLNYGQKSVKNYYRLNMMNEICQLLKKINLVRYGDDGEASGSDVRANQTIAVLLLNQVVDRFIY
jgi:putative acyl-CoA dehydrogenase